jgi:hypothetical protein
MAAPKIINSDYWNNFVISQEDIEFLYNQLLDLEIPQTPNSLLRLIIDNRVKAIKEALEKENKRVGSVIYLPKDHYDIGQTLVFPAFEWRNGHVDSVRKGFNPEYESFDVIDLTFENGDKASFACNLASHLLNNSNNTIKTEPLLDNDFVIIQYGDQLLNILEKNLEKNNELVKIAGCWFPKALLVDIHTGHLNLAEAVLEESKGGPLTTKQLLDQIDLRSSVNSQLVEFSLNYVLQDDKRFDEVGPAGETLWHLKDLEPEDVRKTPSFLQYETLDYDHELVKPYLAQFEGDLFDELEEWEKSKDNSSEIKVSLIFPHWRSGTLPLSHSLSKLFPTAYEAPRVCFTFIDEDNKKSFPGWVVRPHKYVYGLRDWYKNNGLIPGSLVHIKKGDKPGEIKIFYEKCRQSREWMRTALIGSDQGIVFGMLKQNVFVTFNERMSIAVPDPEGFEEIWIKNANKNEDINRIIWKIMRELSKLNPQIHAQELYAAVNFLKRCPPGMILNYLLTNKDVKHLGDLYFRIADNSEGTL